MATTMNMWVRSEVDARNHTYIATLLYKHRNELPREVRDWLDSNRQGKQMSLQTSPDPVRGGFNVLITLL